MKDPRKDVNERIERIMNFDLDRHVLLVVAETDTVLVVRLERPGTRIMSIQLSFTPEGVAVQGDFEFYGPRAVCSNFGYGLDWFSGRLDPNYLAEKFLCRPKRSEEKDHLQRVVSLAAIQRLFARLWHERQTSECTGPGTCHGSLAWCSVCDDVQKTCDDPACDHHFPIGPDGLRPTTPNANAWE